MATFYSTAADGSGVALFVSPPGGVPAGVTFRRDFDAATNAALVGQFNANPQAFSLSGGTLTVGGTPATFQPDGAYFQAKQRAADLLAKLKAVKAGQASFTGEDIADIAAVAFHADGLPSA